MARSFLPVALYPAGSRFRWASVRWLASAALFSLAWVAPIRGEDFRIESLDLSNIEQGWGSPHAGRSVDGHSLSIGGSVFEHGLGTHAPSTFVVALHGQAERLTGNAGVDDEVGKRGSVKFQVVGDGKVLWESKLLRGGEQAVPISVNLQGVKRLVLRVTDGGDDMNYDHADWANAVLTMAAGQPEAQKAPQEPAVVLTPAAPAQPRIHGAQVVGVRPQSPFLYRIAATGQRPMAFEADGLPAGLSLDPATGIITGSLDQPGTYRVNLKASNDLGSASRVLRIVCGKTIALTPPMGWNSWNAFGCDVNEADVRAAADALVASGLIDHGWTYINIDDCWEAGRDAEGNILANEKFPDMQALTAYIHSKGLKIGLYSSPGPKTCAGHTGSYQHEAQDARQYAKWGFDYLKYDWCSYGDIAKHPDHEELMRPYLLMRASLDAVPRDILFSLCQYGMGKVWEWGTEVGGNCWRTTGDISDSWSSMSRIGFGQAELAKYASPGHWNDPDMLVVGYVGWSAHVRPTRLTPNEQYTHISLWSLLSAPLLIGCDLTKLDAFTLNLLGNDEVLAVNQDPLGHQASRVAENGEFQVWSKDLEDGSKAVGLFNLAEDPARGTVQWSDVGLSGAHEVRDLWRQKDLGQFEKEFEAVVPRHGVVLIKIR